METASAGKNVGCHFCQPEEPPSANKRCGHQLFELHADYVIPCNETAHRIHYHGSRFEELRERSASEIFQSAQKAFEDKQYDEARRYAAQAALEVLKEATVTRVGDIPALPEASIIIVVHSYSEDFGEALSRLSNAPREYELVIVDNGFGLTQEFLCKYLKGFILVKIDFNYGCCGARNIGSNFSTSDLVIFFIQYPYISNPKKTSQTGANHITPCVSPIP